MLRCYPKLPTSQSNIGHKAILYPISNHGADGAYFSLPNGPCQLYIQDCGIIRVNEIVREVRKIGRSPRAPVY